MGSLDMKLDGMKFKQVRRKNSRRSRHSNSSSFPLTLILSITAIITFILGLIIMLFTSFFPSITFSRIFELICSIYNQIFTPLYLFFLLNLLIISIFAMTHLHREAPHAASPRRRLSPAWFGHEMQRFRANHAEDQTRFAGIKRNDQDTAAYFVNSAVEKAQDLATSLRSAHRLQRWGDREVNRTNSSDFMYSHEISAAQSTVEDAAESADRVYTAVDEKLSADNDPYFQVNPAVVKEVISDAKLLINVGEMINGDPAAEKSQKAEMYNDDEPTSQTVEEEKTADHNRMVSSADSLILSKKTLLLNTEEASVTPARERPLASSHFTHKKAASRLMHADMLRSNSPLKISRPSVKRGDTLDATWKAICDDKLRHSSRTWKGEHHGNLKKMGATYNKSKGSLSPLSPSKEKHHMPTNPSSGLMKKREHSIPRDELNARVESFISRFNQQIRIQREQSLLNYTNMVNRGAS